ncbi:GNAT family N-acetyltransferase [Arthrobacter bambusae]|uniref:Ribosomal protein S18 acetylase RimI-like enzyme n=1 Tax=Arthrobacter bambusae TaxID=1338426 RepID=A0AAW8D6Y5_9MICC|nr:GNAT family N-acetyltransferase [Arthrobacter bambusae]MDP9904676.1 ribosomal protein S18 acetylase RimI-like enzyme [Arthrobacter bambusae]MDQ0129492.1 ribosomal protein S18 acetylase RimI-like enzyme [Arthrobacter bambusae]MDQ0180895.1 ribosomal protein S18 acetylase RimI-like enzyme [Arthrobacter bambusae]
MTATTPTGTALHTFVRATTSDRENVIAALTGGFSDDVLVAGWMFPDPETYAQHAGGWFACYTDFALEHGYVWTTGDATAALVAMPSEAWQRAQHDEDLKDRVAKATGPCIERVAALDKVFAERHPGAPDHIYFAMGGIQPEHRNKGLGTHMLQNAFELADRMGLACYAEASCERNARLWDRIGLRVTGAPIRVPGYDSDMFSLWRPPSPPVPDAE